MSEDKDDKARKGGAKDATADAMALFEEILQQSADADEPSPLSAVADMPPPASVPLPLPLGEPTVWARAVVDDVTPAAGPILGGTRVTITGDHLYRVSIVRFGEELAQTVGAREPHEIRVLAPARAAAGSVDISVLNPGAELTVIKGGFTYAVLPAPKLESVAPRHADARGGSSLSLHGKNFLRESKVLVGGSAAAKVTFVDASTLEVVIPGGNSGAMVDVAVENPDGKRDVLKRAFKYS